MFRLLKTLCVVIACVQSCLCTNIHTEVYSRLDKVYINSFGNTYIARSAIDCCWTCTKQLDCLSTNYNHQTKVCELMAVDPFQTGISHNEASDWSVFYKAGLHTVNWVQYRDRQYLFDNTTYRSWDDALSFCSLFGAGLVEMRDAEENDFVYQTSDNAGLRRYWIGLTYVEEEGNFLWLSGEPVNYTNLYLGEPNNLVDNAHCIASFLFEIWLDFPCNFIFSTVCVIF